MATYRVKAPDGHVYNVTAPDDATPEQIKARVQSHAAPKPGALDRINSGVGYVRDMVNDSGNLAANKLSMGITDKARGMVEPDVDRRREAYQASHPGFDWGTLPLNIMGAPAKAVEQLAAKFGPGLMKQAAGVGATFGAVSGFGNARGSVGQQIAQTAESTLAGGLLGPVVAKAAPYAISAAEKVSQPIANLIRRYRGPVEDATVETMQNGPSPKPAVRKIIQKALAAQGTTPRQAGQMLDQARARGVPMALMDTGDEMRGLASALARKPGASRTIMRDAVINRQERQGERIQGAITRDLGPVANVRQASEELIKGAREKAGPLYEQAYASPVPMSGKLEELAQRPSMRDALGRAYRIAAEEGRDPKTMGFNLDAEGNVALEPHNSMQTWDYVKRGMDDVIEAGRDPVTGRLKLDEAGRATNATQRQFIKELTTLNPKYGEALHAYAGPAKMATALAKGSKLATRDAEKVWAETRDMTPAELEQYKLGVRSALTKGLGDKGDMADKVKALVGSPNKRKVLSQIFGGDESFDRLISTLGDESALSATYGRAATGSPTAPNLADDAALNDATAIIANAGRRVLGGAGLIRTGIGAVGDTLRYGAGKSGEVVRAQLASGLSETRPEVLAARLRELSAARNTVKTNLIKSAKRGRKASRIAGIGAGKLLGGDDR
jgi:hypothetical protein